MADVPIRLFIFIVIIGLSTTLQIFLSLRKNKWYGLFIPILCFLFGILTGPAQLIFGTSIAQALLVTIISLIPFFFNLIIYFACRSKLKEKQKMNSEIDKMKIKDL
ncbi:hypothetical protein [Wukongibacter sp. M2B1]|uniref:hypothetical protein n=1 Tax=Wukongibacter sp. M2B1 TaxID=3088895 RepID=UPI003D7A84DC